MKVLTSLNWCYEATRAMRRCLELRLIALRMLAELPADRAAHYRAELGGIDKRIRAMYDWNQVTKQHNDTNTASGNPSQSPSGHQ